ncbi:hypothetical protein CN318_29755 [Bacillus cereus]|nr:hypothetical protein CN318_29755 [Bacillus cereus]PFQ61207.1 hypothetical protein COK21_27780 [Bacillus cereus]
MNLNSKLSDHKIKKGKVIAPWNHLMGDTLSLNSWAKDRLPEYIWIALIHCHYGRSESISILHRILKKFMDNSIEIGRPKLSSILSLDNERKSNALQIIYDEVDKYVLSPLTLILRRKNYPEFNDFFYINEMKVEDKINRINHVMKNYIDHQSYEATDLRYMVIMNLVMNGSIAVSSDLDIAPDAIMYYPTHDHDEEIMKMYRPSIRSLEGLDVEETNNEFVSLFKKELAMVTQCNPVYTSLSNSNNANPINDDLIIDISKALELNVSLNKESLITDSKYEVMIGSIYYSLKIFKEILELGQVSSILGRHGIRTIIEVYIMMKYMVNQEQGNSDIWYEYKLYGIGKYKMILLKSRESNNEIEHLVEPIVDAIVNEIQSEEFTDVDLTYFDKKGIREKCILVNEKLLYDLYYDYDTNYTHGLWGAVRESAMLVCDNPSHYYHNVPDTNFHQKLSSVAKDFEFVFFKLLSVFNQQYELPDWFLKKYREKIDANT